MYQERERRAKLEKWFIRCSNCGVLQIDLGPCPIRPEAGASCDACGASIPSHWYPKGHRWHPKRREYE